MTNIPMTSGVPIQHDSLPREFADLDIWTGRWCVETQQARLERRVSSSMEELTIFYEAVLPHAERMIDYLNARPTDDLTEMDLRLFRLLQSFFETSLAVELLHGPDGPAMFAPDRVQVDFDG